MRPPCTNPRPHPPALTRASLAGFTLMEVMVATVLLAVLLSFTVQITTQTDTAIRVSERRIGIQSQARTALDRFEADFSTAMLTAGATAIVRDKTGTDPNSSIRFLCLSRARDTGPVATSQPRAAIIGYEINEVERSLDGETLPPDTLIRGDGKAHFSGANSSFAQIYGTLSKAAPPAMKWEPIGDGLLRFHISYVLDDGTITQSPPEFFMVSAQTELPVSFLNGLTLDPGWKAVAFHQENAPTSGRYVVALRIAVAGASPDVIAKARKAGQLAQVVSGLGSPSSTQSALQVWESNLAKIDFLPLRQSIRFYQRTIPVR